jgi:hypothetical protein
MVIGLVSGVSPVPKGEGPGHLRCGLLCVEAEATRRLNSISSYNRDCGNYVRSTEARAQSPRARTWLRSSGAVRFSFRLVLRGRSAGAGTESSGSDILGSDFMCFASSRQTAVYG